MDIKKLTADLIKQYELTAADIYFNDETGFILISGAGIRRIVFDDEVVISKDLKHISLDGKTVVVECTAVAMDEKGATHHYSALGEVSPDNNTFHYPVNTAEKRAEARAVLNAVGLYHQGVRGEDEIDNLVRGQRLTEKKKEQATTAVQSVLTQLEETKTTKRTKALKIKIETAIDEGKIERISANAAVPQLSESEGAV